MLKHKKIDSWSITNQLTLLKDTTPPPLIFRVIDLTFIGIILEILKKSLILKFYSKIYLYLNQ